MAAQTNKIATAQEEPSEEREIGFHQYLHH
jgi:hypothetical protein